NAGGGFADYVVAESDALEPSNSQGVANDLPGPGASFADYVAAESNASESLETEDGATNFDAASLSAFPEPGASFADYVAAENDATQEAANDGDAASEADSNLADYVASKPVDDFESNEAEINEEKTRFAFDDKSVSATVAGEDETALAARLQDEMKERGVGNPRIERWGGRFWRASGFATTSEGVATFCEAVDVDPTSAQRAALAKFDAANF
ncbi:MAG: hypothetical protein IKY61_04315, partial [Thermoguttaceae bacterium]|nr:hypothetical protein [Thermoguttaceae bacterium]